jgi:hypothetical protein
MQAVSAALGFAATVSSLTLTLFVLGGSETLFVFARGVNQAAWANRRVRSSGDPSGALATMVGLSWSTLSGRARQGPA